MARAVCAVWFKAGTLVLLKPVRSMLRLHLLSVFHVVPYKSICHLQYMFSLLKPEIKIINFSPTPWWKTLKKTSVWWLAPLIRYLSKQVKLPASLLRQSLVSWILSILFGAPFNGMFSFHSQKMIWGKASYYNGLPCSWSIAYGDCFPDSSPVMGMARHRVRWSQEKGDDFF